MLVSSKELPLVWPKVVPLLVKGKSAWEEYFELEDIRTMILSGRAQLWLPIEELVLITELVQHPKIMVLNLLIAVGDNLNEALKHLRDIELWAKELGATKAIGIGRKGFLRVLAPSGYRQRAVAFEKDL